MTSAAEACIEQCIRDDPCTTMASIKHHIQTTLGLVLSEECVRLHRVSLNLTRKKVQRVVTKPGLHMKRKQFEMDRKAHSADDVISIDESSFWFSMKPSYGYF